MGKYYNVAANAGGGGGLWDGKGKLFLTYSLNRLALFFMMSKFDFIYLK